MRRVVLPDALDDRGRRFPFEHEDGVDPAIAPELLQGILQPVGRQQFE